MNRTSARILLIGYIIIAIIGAFVLTLPIMHKGNLSFIDALFTSSSAVSVTRLIFKNTESDFSVLGQFVILLIIQIGVFGYMSVTSFIYLILRLKIELD